MKNSVELFREAIMLSLENATVTPVTATDLEKLYNLVQGFGLLPKEESAQAPKCETTETVVSKTKRPVPTEELTED